LDAILVTHAHSDHTGGLPVVAEAFASTPIYMTPPTRSLVEILQRDALKLMSLPSDREADVPLYGERQVEAMLGQVRPVHHHESIELGDIRVTYLPASHILGASMVHLETPGGNVLFTGDYSVAGQRTVASLGRPELPVDLVITESTYGNRIHADRKLAEERLLHSVGQSLEQGGRVLIPAFAIGRAQEVLLILRDGLRRGRIPHVPIFVDGMVRSVCGAYPQHERYLEPALRRQMRTLGHPFFGDDVKAVRDLSERRQIVSGGACVIVSSSGMLSGGPSAFYASEFAGNERDAILITGYQDEESPGRALLDLASQQGPRTLTVAGRTVDVRCRFESYSLSGHADRMQMVGLLEAMNPRVVGLVHGDRDAKEALARSLGDRDVVLCDDGIQLERTFVTRTRRAVRPGADRGRAEELVGLEPDRALDAPELARAWFGRDVADERREGLVRELTALGLVALDDAGVLRARPSRPATPEQLAEERLRQQNPKGKVHEWCTRRRVKPPQLFESRSGGHDQAELVLVVDGQTLRGGPVLAASRKLAERLELAPEVVGGQLLGEPAVEPGVRVVDAADSERLRGSNFKGKLLELSMKHKTPRPTYESLTRPGAMRSRGLLRLHGGVRHLSSWYQATSGRDAEHAASEELL
ncbi:MAG: MBL fold metallo-hydrolase, partial [Myxococcales bacterium]